MIGRSALLSACAMALLFATGPAPARAQAAGATAPGASASQPLAIAWSKIAGQLEDMRARYGVTALIVGVGIADAPPLVAVAGTSITGVPARGDMHFRIGAVAIAAQTTILMQLVDEGRVKLDDTIDKWLPDYPEASKVTLRMLADSTSGYADYESDPGFVRAFESDVFRAWPTDELLKIAFARGMVFEPGTGFQYAHTNFIVLAQALAKATGTPYPALLQQRIIDRLGLKQTRIWTTAELPDPPLHGFTKERGVFEDATYWSPSWTSFTGPLNADMGDTVRLMRALGRGETISKESLRLMLTPATLGKGINTPEHAFSLGMEILPPWVKKTFFFGGYAGVAGYKNAQDLTLVVLTTLGSESAPDKNPSTPIFDELAAALAH
ncbi:MULTISPECIES: serine hydrolase [unclassified Xanthobacter]|uniref:serine hydrolase domain-containing protein n=1 Tax=unclassified Xanthobacter TaxID=2623496 RepID=UPI001F26569D|nr:MULTISPECIES: serine hydrolase domain-containing protein [unclassified Xanthobacter]